MEHVGDFILTSGAIREIRRNYPYANITLIVSPQSYSVAECCPYVNEILTFDTSIVRKNIAYVLEDVMNFAKKYLWKKHFVLGFNLRYTCLPHTLVSLLLYLSGARERVGSISKAKNSYVGGITPTADKNPGNIFMTKNPLIDLKKIVSNCARPLQILIDYGLKIQNTDLELWYKTADSMKARKIMGNFARDKIRVAVGINGANPARRYPVQKYLPALKKIIEKNTAIIIFGGSSEVDDAKFLQENLPACSVLNLTEILPGRRVESAILTEYTDLYLGNMTGTSDMAAAAHLPCVLIQPTPESLENSLFGVSAISVCYPWQTNAMYITPEISDEKIKNKSMKELLESSFIVDMMNQVEPEQIVDAFDEMIHFLKFSGIRKTTCPPIIRSIDATKKLTGLFDKV